MTAARQVDASLPVAGDSLQGASADPRPAAAALQAAVCFGAVMHERHVQAHNRFIYPTAFLRLPLSKLAALRAPLLGIERASVFTFRNRDHGARDGSPLLPWIHALLHGQGLAEICDGEIVLQTMPRIFGFVFNPVSFWFCHDRLAGDIARRMAAHAVRNRPQTYIRTREDGIFIDFSLCTYIGGLRGSPD